MKKEKRNRKVIVAMSGGVDSSVAAALLKKRGFNVVGVFMKFWSEPEKNGLVGTWNRCCSPEAEGRARKVAKILKIPFYVFNFKKEFKKKIVDYFLKEYKDGKTPNPCVVCNKEIKFGLLLKKALVFDADYLASGHYVRTNLLNFSTGVEKFNTDRRNYLTIELLRAKDKNKDQSYFLWMLNQKQLRKILFPVGNYTKTQVRNLAKKFKLSVSDTPESMEICFIKKSINDFLKKHLKLKLGKIVNTEGKIIGKHQGLWFYTIGQRKGIGLSGGPAFAKASAGKPYYVLDKDFKKNLLIVTKKETDLYKKELIAKNINWTLDKAPKLPLRVMAKIRYRHKPVSATITKILNSKFYLLKFDKPQRAITPGQSVVFYKGQELLGGGIIA
jgi:tRNA-specific 2-thiouridylase